MELEEARAQIREVDGEMLALFARRMELVREVARVKAERGLPVEDAAQEARVLAELVPQMAPGPLRGFYVQFQQGVMDVSKRWQEFLIAEAGAETGAEKADAE